MRSETTTAATAFFLFPCPPNGKLFFSLSPLQKKRAPRGAPLSHGGSEQNNGFFLISFFFLIWKGNCDKHSREKNAIFLPRFHGKFALTKRGKSNGKKQLASSIWIQTCFLPNGLSLMLFCLCSAHLCGK